MKFSGNVPNGTRNKSLDFGSDLDPSLFKGSYPQIILRWILKIVQELSSSGGGLRSPSALDSTWILIQQKQAEAMYLYFYIYIIGKIVLLQVSF